MTSQQKTSKTNHVKKGILDDENKTILRIIKIIAEHEPMTVQSLHQLKQSLSPILSQFAGFSAKSFKNFIKKHKDIFNIATGTGYVTINPRIIPTITFLNNKSLKKAKCILEKTDVYYGFLLTMDGETVYFRSNVFETGNIENLKSVLEPDDVFLVNAKATKNRYNAHWDATKVKRINNAVITCSLNSAKGEIIDKYSLLLENRTLVKIPPDITSQIAIRTGDKLLCNAVKRKDGDWLATKIFVTLRSRNGEEFEPEVILENIIEDYVGCIDRLTSTYGFIKHGMSEEDHIYFTQDAVKSGENTTSSLLTDFLCIGDEVKCNADSIDNFTCKYRANIVTIIEKIDIVETISGSTMQNCEGTITKLKPSDGVLLFGSDKTWTEVCFSVEEFYRDGHLVQRLDWCLEVGGKVMFDAVKQGDYGKCKWKALLVWRGNKPRIVTRIDKRRMVEEELIKKFPLFNAEFQISDVPIVTITSKKEKVVKGSDCVVVGKEVKTEFLISDVALKTEKEIDVVVRKDDKTEFQISDVALKTEKVVEMSDDRGGDSCLVVGKDVKTEFKCTVAEEMKKSKVKRKRIRKKKTVNSQSLELEATGKKYCPDEIENESHNCDLDLAEPEIDTKETTTEILPSHGSYISFIPEVEAQESENETSFIPEVVIEESENETSYISFIPEVETSFIPEVVFDESENETSFIPEVVVEESENETSNTTLSEVVTQESENETSFISEVVIEESENETSYISFIPEVETSFIPEVVFDESENETSYTTLPEVDTQESENEVENEYSENEYVNNCDNDAPPCSSLALVPYRSPDNILTEEDFSDLEILLGIKDPHGFYSDIKCFVRDHFRQLGISCFRKLAMFSTNTAAYFSEDGYDEQLNEYMDNHQARSPLQRSLRGNYSVDASTQTMFTGEISCSNIYHE